MNLKRLITGNSRLAEVMRFAMVGFVATVLQYGIYVVFVEAVKVPAVPSTMISYAISFISIRAPTPRTGSASRSPIL